MAGASAIGVMAGRGGSGLDASGNSSLVSSLTPAELAEIREYGKLVRFRDAVVSGTHPRVRPSHLPAKPAQSQKPLPTSASAASAVPTPTQPAAARNAVKSGRPVIDNSKSQQANKQRAQVNMTSSVPGLGTLSGVSANQISSVSGKPEINPVLLEKSDDLIKAEIQLQRQRLERSLKEQLEQRRAVNKASEQLAELDVADIMAKAMSLVHATPPVQSTDDTAANVSASNDSADDDTFYSSRHDTPESNMAPRLPNSEDEEMRDGSPYEPELDFEPPAQPQVQPAAVPTQVAPVGAASKPPPQQLNAPAPAQAASSTAGVMVPGLSIGASSSTRVYQPQVAEASGAAAQTSAGGRSGGFGATGGAQLSGTHGPARDERALDQALVREPHLVRGHDLSPLAPQPTHGLPAIARDAQLNAIETSGAQAAPAQVAALRKQPSNGSSPESSPHSSKAAEKKKNKKKKRKADRLAADAAAASPYIKPEPRSPSPMTPQYARPNKRQRYSQQQPLEIPDEEPRYEQRVPVEEGYQERFQPPRVVRQERVVGYERADDYRPHHGEEPILITSPRYERVYYDDYRAPPPSGYPAAPESQYVAREVRTVRPASRIEGPYEDGATYYRDVRAASRMSVRPAAYLDRSQSPVGYERPPAAMPPPRAPPRRIIVDAFGREYLEPVRPATVVREEVATEPRGPYERVLPPRAISPRPELLDDDAVLYHPNTPAYAAPRRVVTQPEYSYRETAGASNPMAPPTAEYHPSRPDPAREYITRPSSVRPAMEPARYDSGPPTYERFQPPADDRPPPPRDYYRAASALPAAADGAAATRYEIPVAYEPIHSYPPPLRSASVRPAVDAIRYDMPREYASSSRRVEYATPPSAASPAGYHPHHPQHHLPPHLQEVRRETMPPPPPARAYSVVPPGEQIVRREYVPTQQQQLGERYYDRPPQQPSQQLGQQQQQMGREDDEVVFLERGPVVREGYR